MLVIVAGGGGGGDGGDGGGGGGTGDVGGVVGFGLLSSSLSFCFQNTPAFPFLEKLTNFVTVLAAPKWTGHHMNPSFQKDGNHLP